MALKAPYLVVAIAGIAVASAAAYWWQNGGQLERQGEGLSSAPAKPASAIVVEAGEVRSMRMADEAQAVGSLRSRQTVTLRPEVNGRIIRLNFQDGSQVRKGQLLVQLDDQLEQAQLRQAQAQLAIARTNHQRNQELAARKFISASAVDQSAAALQVAQAQHALAMATVARLRIVAPFDGVSGIANVSVGDYLSAGQEIVNLEDMAVMFLDYRLPERYQTKLKSGQVARATFDALPGESFDARIMAIDPRIDAEGRSLNVRASIDNAAQHLRPGMFARVSAVFDVRDNVIVVPEESVVLSDGLPYVYRILGQGREEAMSERVQVKLGARRQGYVELASGGFEPGQRIVVAGQQRLRDGTTPVRIAPPDADGGSDSDSGADKPTGGASRASKDPKDTGETKDNRTAKVGAAT